MRRAKVVVMVYNLKWRVTVWRAARCLRPCDRLSNPSSVIQVQLTIRASYQHYNLQGEVESDRMDSYKVSKTL